jgi:hypothetical protein
VRDFSQLTDMHGASLFTKSEEFGYAFLKTKGSKIGIGIAAAAGLIAAGKWAFSRHNSEAPAPSHFSSMSGSMPESISESMSQGARFKLDAARNAFIELSPSKRFEEPETKLPQNFKSIEK